MSCLPLEVPEAAILICLWVGARCKVEALQLLCMPALFVSSQHSDPVAATITAEMWWHDHSRLEPSSYMRTRLWRVRQHMLRKHLAVVVEHAQGVGEG